MWGWGGAHVLKEANRFKKTQVKNGQFQEMEYHQITKQNETNKHTDKVEVKDEIKNTGNRSH